MLLLYMLATPIVPVMYRYLGGYFDTATQTGYRFFAGGAVLMAICVLRYRVELRSTLADPRQLRSIALLSVLWVAGITMCVEGIQRTSAVLSGLAAAVGIPLTAVAALAVFPEERQVVRGARFWVGSALALGGAVAVALSEQDGGFGYSLGVLLLVGYMVFWSTQALVAKRALARTHPLVASALLVVLSAVIFLAISAATGGIGAIARAPALVDGVLFASGVVGLILGAGVYLIVIEQSGVVVSRFAELAAPVLIGVYEYVLFRDTLSGLQMAFGALVLVGCLLVVWRKVGPAEAQTSVTGG